MMEYTEGVGRIFTLDDRDYFIMISNAKNNKDEIDRIYQMIYKDSEGKMQRRKFMITVRYPDGMINNLSGLNDAPVFNFLANDEVSAKNFITFLCFGRDNSFIIEDYKMTQNAEVMSHNVIVYVTPIQ